MQHVGEQPARVRANADIALLSHRDEPGVAEHEIPELGERQIREEEDQAPCHGGAPYEGEDGEHHYDGEADREDYLVDPTGDVNRVPLVAARNLRKRSPS